MTSDQKLDLILDKLQVLSDDVAELKTEVAELKDDVAVLKIEVAELKGDVAVLKTDVANLKGDVAVLKTDVSKLQTEMTEVQSNMQTLEQAQLKTQMILENTVDKCIQALGEGYQLNAERLDRSDIESIKRQSELSFMLAKATNEKVERIAEELNRTA